MRTTLFLATLAGSLGGVSCGDNAAVPLPRCVANDSWSSNACEAATLLAVRESGEFRAEPVLVESLFVAIKDAIAEEPVISGLSISSCWQFSPFYNYSFYTQNVDIIDAWTNGNIHTGLANVDALIEARGATYAGCGDSFPEDPSTHLCSVAFPNIHDCELEAPKFSAAVGSFVDPAEPFTVGSDVEMTRISDDAVDILFTIGRGDCLLGCTWQHRWNYAVTGLGTSAQTGVLTDLGGDPLTPPN